METNFSHLQGQSPADSVQVAERARLQAKLFAPDAVRVFTDQSAQNLTHTYSPHRYNVKGECMDFDSLCGELSELKNEVVRWHANVFGAEFDPYNPGAQIAEVQNKFYQDERFQRACLILDISPDQYKRITLPWWSEKGGAEQDFDPESLTAKLLPRHSYETQLMRAGVDLPIRNVSVAGIPLTKPDQESPNGKFMIGVRAGVSFPETMHMFAGALRMTAGLCEEKESIFEVFERTEMSHEIGLSTKDLSEASLIAHVKENAIENGSYYIFLLKTELSEEQLISRWQSNPHKDRAEHSRPVFIENSKDSVLTFLQKHYRGLVANRVSRRPEEALVLHPTALALMGIAGIDSEEVSALIQPGVW